MGAMELAALIDMSIPEFWEITPFELNVAARGYAKRREVESKQLAVQAYRISSWVWMKPRARHRELKKLLGERKVKKVMTDEQMLEQVRALNAAFGGAVVRR